MLGEAGFVKRISQLFVPLFDKEGGGEIFGNNERRS
jgi:hypothetical protein